MCQTKEPKLCGACRAHAAGNELALWPHTSPIRSCKWLLPFGSVCNLTILDQCCSPTGYVAMSHGAADMQLSANKFNTHSHIPMPCQRLAWQWTLHGCIKAMRCVATVFFLPVVVPCFCTCIRPCHLVHRTYSPMGYPKPSTFNPHGAPGDDERYSVTKCATGSALKVEEQVRPRRMAALLLSLGSGLFVEAFVWDHSLWTGSGSRSCSCGGAAWGWHVQARPPVLRICTHTILLIPCSHSCSQAHSCLHCYCHCCCCGCCSHGCCCPWVCNHCCCCQWCCRHCCRPLCHNTAPHFGPPHSQLHCAAQTATQTHRNQEA